MKGSGVLVLGNGPAGLVCACLLRARGQEVRLVRATPAQEPVLALNDVTVDLLRDLCGLQVERLPAVHGVARRVVSWETGHPVAREQRILGVPLRELRLALTERALAAGVEMLDQVPAGDHGHAWVIDARGRHGRQAAGVLTFGARVAHAAPVRLSERHAGEQGVLEAVAGGWLFLLPRGEGRAVLQGVPAASAGTGDDLHSLLQASRLIGPQVEAFLGDTQRFDAMPRLGLDLSRAGWLAIGDAAVAFDPISGNGLGCGLRTALLANAVTQAIDAGDDAQACLGHYASRLAVAACDHVRLCLSLYRSARWARPWATEIDAMEAALARCAGPAARFDRVLDRTGLRRVAAPSP